MEQGYARRKLQRLVMVMGHEDRGQAKLLMQSLKFQPHFLAKLSIQIGKRFVEQQRIGLYDDRAGQRHALLLAAGQLVRRAVSQPFQPN